ncbi:response regulator [bacterium]|nr:response regulator [bacterium]
MSQAKRVLVVDDEESVRAVLSRFLTKQGISFECADSGENAIQCLQMEDFDFVITDLMMPDIDGLELLRRIKTKNHKMPVAIITGFGTLEIAVEALRSGAVDFIKKPFDFKHISQLLAKVFDRQERETSQQKAISHITSAALILPNDISVLESAGTIASAALEGLPEYNGVCLAIIESLTNAMEHGNLEITHEEKDEAISNGNFHEIERSRRDNPKLGQRKIFLRFSLTGETFTCVIRDEGNGFDWKNLPDPRTPENIFNASGRGVLLIRCYMDDVSWNEKGNEITMTKKLGK